jgi:hypothetical protein
MMPLASLALFLLIRTRLLCFVFMLIDVHDPKVAAVLISLGCMLAGSLLANFVKALLSSSRMGRESVHIRAAREYLRKR